MSARRKHALKINLSTKILTNIVDFVLPVDQRPDNNIQAME